MGRANDGDANELIARFGGQSALARALGVNQSTVQHWSKTGHLPSWRREQIERAAQQHGVALGGEPARAARPTAKQPARPMMGYARASTSVGHSAPPSPFVHGRADAVVMPDREIGQLRDEIAQLRSLVEQLVGAVDELKGARAKRTTASKGQRATPSKKSRS